MQQFKNVDKAAEDFNPLVLDVVNKEARHSANDLIQLFGGTKAAAAAIGASQRSVQRWIAGHAKPSNKYQKEINRVGNENVDSKTVTMKGKIWIGGSDKKPRDRKLHFDLDGEVWRELVATAAQGDAMGCWMILGDAYGGVGIMELVEGTGTLTIQ